MIGGGNMSLGDMCLGILFLDGDMFLGGDILLGGGMFLGGTFLDGDKLLCKGDKSLVPDFKWR